MSDRPQGEGWWLASDGKWYPPESRPGAPVAPAPPGAPPQVRLSAGLHRAVRVFLYLTAAAAGLAVVGMANAIPKVDAWWSAPIGSDAVELAAWQDAFGLAQGASGLLGVSGLALIVLLMVWGSQAYRSLERYGAGGRSWSPGWAVGGWFIPLGNMVIPRLVLSEIERIPHPGNGPAPVGDRWRERSLLAAGLGWWIGLVASAIIVGIGAGVVEAGSEISGEGSEMITTITDGTLYRNGLVVVTAGIAGIGIAQLLGASYFKVLGERLGR
jgi:hypothetical protein